MDTLSAQARAVFEDWFTWLRSRQPPLATMTYNIRLFHLRRMLEELAWTEDLPILARLILQQDHPAWSAIFRAR